MKVQSECASQFEQYPKKTNSGFKQLFPISIKLLSV